MQKKQQDKYLNQALEEIKMVNCPYLGKGKYDPEAMKSLLMRLKEESEEMREASISKASEEIVKENDISSKNSLIGPSIQIVTDKNDFLTGFIRKILLIFYTNLFFLSFFGLLFVNELKFLIF